MAGGRPADEPSTDPEPAWPGVATIALDSITKRFGTTAVLHDISLSIPNGTFFSLLGAVRLRQVDPAADHRRVGKPDRRHGRL